MSKSSTSVNRKALKLDNKVKAINHCDVGKSCRVVGEEMGLGCTQIMNILKRKREILDDFENNASSSTSCYWKLYFYLLNTFIYLFICMFYSNHIQGFCSPYFTAEFRPHSQWKIGSFFSQNRSDNSQTNRNYCR
jgi:hypothetical protein